MAEAVNNEGLNLMVDGIGQEATLYLVARDISAQNDYVHSVTYDSAVGGIADIHASVTIVITDNDAVIDYVVLATSGYISTATLIATSATINSAFAYGGDLIVTSFEITVANPV